jgi:hypothetical protein
MTDVSYTSTERIALSALALFGFVALNGAFLYGLLLAPAAMTQAMTNPVALAFMIEALVLVPVFAYLFAKWQVSRLPSIWFVVLSILGGLAFSVPIAVLYRRR